MGLRVLRCARGAAGAGLEEGRDARPGRAELAARPAGAGLRGEALEQRPAERLPREVHVAPAVARGGARRLLGGGLAEGAVAVAAELAAVRGERDVGVGALALERDAERPERGAAGVSLHRQAVALLPRREGRVALEHRDADAALLERERQGGAADAGADDRDRSPGPGDGERDSRRRRGLGRCFQVRCWPACCCAAAVSLTATFVSLLKIERSACALSGVVCA